MAKRPMEFNWDPFEDLRRVQQRIGRILGEMPESPGMPQEMTGVPNVDVVERGSDVIVTADLPGIDKSDIRINVKENDVLEISAEKKAEKEEKEQGFVRHERTYNRFYRAVQLPAPVDKRKAKASYNNGVLEITLPMTEKPKGSDIPVS